MHHIFCTHIIPVSISARMEHVHDDSSWRIHFFGRKHRFQGRVVRSRVQYIFIVPLKEDPAGRGNTFMANRTDRLVWNRRCANIWILAPVREQRNPVAKKGEFYKEKRSGSIKDSRWERCAI